MKPTNQDQELTLTKAMPRIEPITTELAQVPQDYKQYTPARIESPNDLFAVVARAAMSPDVDPAKMRELLAMRRELQAEEAKQKFDMAFAAFQAECPVIQKLKAVEVGGRKMYSYSPLEDIVTVIKPICQKHGFSFRFDTDVKSEPGWVIAFCDVKHSAGHVERSTAKFPLGGKTNLMSDTQQYSAALTFATRRVLGQSFGLVFAGEDLDGRTAKLKPKGPSSLAADLGVKPLAQELWTLLVNVRGTEANWTEANQWMQNECVLGPDEFAPHLSPEHFRFAINKAKEKLK